MTPPVRAAALAAAALVLGACAARANVVHTAQGDVAGVTAGGVESFKGIPFAAPPVADLRWRPPQPAARWTGVRKSGAFGPICMQSSRSFFASFSMSEDCLTLNVWRPAGARPGARLPVMVWICGGAFVGGGSSIPFYDGSHFARDGVILVSFNYRLGRFGFFAHPALDGQAAPFGNYGLMDQIAALKWVRANIAGFGGDPANVTAFGESAGAISVNYLMVSPAAKGLFDKAIAESGFGRSEPRALSGPRSAEAIGTAFAEAHGIKGDGPAAAAALRALPADALNAPTGGFGDPGLPGPLDDGRIVAGGIAEGFAAGAEAHVPYMEGGNSYEASLFPKVADNPAPLIARAGDPAKVEAAYGGAPPAELARELMTDTMITEPDRFLARQMARQGLPAYVYHFTYVPAAARAASHGAPHGSEIGYVFENLPDRPIRFGAFAIPAATPADRQVARAMHAYWVAFAKRGDPGSAGGPAWPRFATGDERSIEFGADGVAVRRDFEKPRLDLIEAARGRRPS
ncbi:MAG TPA: carboxylesterase family protein [Caulobacteraceae bacterium]